MVGDVSARSAVAALVFLVIASSTSTAEATEPRALGETRASMYLTSLDGGIVHLQLHLCRRPGPETGCRRMGDGVRDGIAAGFAGAIRFVRREWTGSDATYWVLSPVRFGARLARFRYHWNAPDGCTGRGAERFRRAADGWSHAGGRGSIGCPV
jgi:hypothetical protein